MSWTAQQASNISKSTRTQNANNKDRLTATNQTYITIYNIMKLMGPFLTPT